MNYKKVDRLAKRVWRAVYADDALGASNDADIVTDLLSAIIAIAKKQTSEEAHFWAKIAERKLSLRRTSRSIHDVPHKG